LEDLLFDVPDAMRDDSFVVDRKMVTEKLAGVVQNRDLSQYIL